MTSLSTHTAFATAPSLAKANPIPAAVAGVGYGPGGVVESTMSIRFGIDSVRAA